jgi:predicted acyltransferase (DUF342 family)
MLDPQTFVIPDNTRMEERTIVVDGGAIIGGHSNIEYGIIADEIVIGEHATVCGEVHARSDVHIDRWSNIEGGVDADGDAHLDEFVKIHGKLTVGGDLDIGENVSINDGFEARGWITIKNPLPIIIFLYMYLSELLRHGMDEEVEKAIQELFADESDPEGAILAMVVPGSAKISLSAIETDHPMQIGDNCRLQGNIHAKSLFMGNATTLFGSIRAKDVTIQENNIIHGNIDAKGDVCIEGGCHILGDVRARAIRIHRDAVVDGTMDAPGGIMIKETKESEETDEGEGLKGAREPDRKEDGLEEELNEKGEFGEDEKELEDELEKLGEIEEESEDKSDNSKEKKDEKTVEDMD